MRVTSKGQVTIPRHIRQRRGLGPGTEVEFLEKGGEVVVTKSRARGKVSRRADDDFAAYLERVRGIVDLGMTSDEFMQLLRGE
jgi:AbrB family looped-hinge helix DNA binding protein